MSTTFQQNQEAHQGVERDAEQIVQEKSRTPTGAKSTSKSPSPKTSAMHKQSIAGSNTNQRKPPAGNKKAEKPAESPMNLQGKQARQKSKSKSKSKSIPKKEA